VACDTASLAAAEEKRRKADHDQGTGCCVVM
jgi:hypothetical protein